MTPIHCAWCGRDFPPTKNDRPKQHPVGKTTCVGSGQVRAVHESIARTKAAMAKRKGEAK